MGLLPGVWLCEKQSMKKPTECPITLNLPIILKWDL